MLDSGSERKKEGSLVQVHEIWENIDGSYYLAGSTHFFNHKSSIRTNFTTT